MQPVQTHCWCDQYSNDGTCGVLGRPIDCLFWKRYVNDTCTAAPKDRVNDLLQHLSGLKKVCIPFLDVLISWVSVCTEKPLTLASILILTPTIHSHAKELLSAPCMAEENHIALQVSSWPMNWDTSFMHWGWMATLNQHHLPAVQESPIRSP